MQDRFMDRNLFSFRIIAPNVKAKDKSLPCETLHSRSNEVAVSQGEKAKVITA